jgi:hypothetical protein
MAQTPKTLIRKLNGPHDKVGGKEIELPLDEADKLIAAGLAVYSIKRIIVTGNLSPFNAGEVAGFPLHVAVNAIQSGAARPHPDDADSMGFAIPVRIPELHEVMESGCSEGLALWFIQQVTHLSKDAARGAPKSEVDARALVIDADFEVALDREEAKAEAEATKAKQRDAKIAKAKAKAEAEAKAKAEAEAKAKAEAEAKANAEAEAKANAETEAAQTEDTGKAETDAKDKNKGRSRRR